MKRLCLPCLLVCLSFWACDSAGDGDPGGGQAVPGPDASTGGGGDEGGQVPADLSCEIVSPAADAIIGGAVDVAVSCNFAAASVELLIDGESALSVDLDGVATDATLSWDPAMDGACDVAAKAVNADGTEVETDAVTVLVDITEPTGAIKIRRMKVLDGVVDVAIEVADANLASVRLLDARYDDPVELAGANEAVNTLTWDTTQDMDGVVWLVLEVTDTAGHVTTTEPYPVVVANIGFEAPVEYIPAPQVYVPSNYAVTEYHTRVMTESKPGVWKVVSWLTWPAEEDWLMELSLGQGFCPHNGIRYVLEESRSGEIIIELPREDLRPDVTAQDAAFDANPYTFPFSNDPARFGSFFGHISPMEPAEKVEQSVAIEVHYVLLYLK